MTSKAFRRISNDWYSLACKWKMTKRWTNITSVSDRLSISFFDCVVAELKLSIIHCWMKNSVRNSYTTKHLSLLQCLLQSTPLNSLAFIKFKQEQKQYQSHKITNTTTTFRSSAIVGWVNFIGKRRFEVAWRIASSQLTPNTTASFAEISTYTARHSSIIITKRDCSYIVSARQIMLFASSAFKLVLSKRSTSMFAAEVRSETTSDGRTSACSCCSCCCCLVNCIWRS